MDKFEMNYDLIPVKYKDKHNWIHLIGTIFLSIMFYIWTSSIPISVGGAYLLGILWEIGDGFKPWFYSFRYNTQKTYWRNWLREELLYSNKFSIQDALIWDLGGAIIGYLLIILYNFWRV